MEAKRTWSTTEGDYSHSPSLLCHPHLHPKKKLTLKSENEAQWTYKTLFLTHWEDS